MRRKQIVIMGVSGICLLALAASLALPRLLVQQATEAPSINETGTFVTRQSESVDLNQKLQQSLLAAGVAVQSDPPTESEPPADSPEELPATAANEAVQTENAPVDTRPEEEVVWRSPPRQPAADTLEVNASLENREAVMPTETPPSRPPQARRSATPAAASQPAKQASQPQAFEVSMSENDISNMVYGQLQRGIDPRYRQALQGVSTRIQQGKARVTVALLPKHLPEGFLKNLPGVTPSTPTVYLGGEMSLYQQGSRVVADVHHISLGNFKVPMPFIQSAVRSQVEAYSQQMLRLPDGRQAELYSVALEQGALTLTGIVN